MLWTFGYVNFQGKKRDTVFVHLHAHAQIAAHPPLSSESMHSELEVFHAIFAFVTASGENVEYQTISSSEAATCVYCIDG